MILCIDIGNTNTHLGVFLNRKLIAKEAIPNSLLTDSLLNKIIRISVPKASASGGRPASGGNGGKKFISALRQIVFCSTKPDIESIITQWAEKVFKLTPLKAGKDFPIPLTNKTIEPEKVGKDRLLNAFGAYYACQAKTYIIVIDGGTAVTFNVVSPKGEFLGGVIAPGLNTLAKSLNQNCALLPLINAPKTRPSVIGKNTKQAINAGVYYGFAGLVKNIAYELIMEYKNPMIIVTGGDASLIKSAIGFKCKVIPDLTLRGLLESYLSTPKKQKAK